MFRVTDHTVPSSQGEETIQRRMITKELQNPPIGLKVFKNDPIRETLNDVTLFFAELLDRKRKELKDKPSGKPPLFAPVQLNVDYERRKGLFLAVLVDYFASTSLADFADLESFNRESKTILFSYMTKVHFGGKLGLNPLLVVYIVENPVHRRPWISAGERVHGSDIFQKVKKMVDSQGVYQALPPVLRAKLGSIEDRKDAQMLSALLMLLLLQYPRYLGNVEIDTQDDKTYKISVLDMEEGVTWNTMDLVFGLNELFYWQPIKKEAIVFHHPKGQSPYLTITAYRLLATEIVVHHSSTGTRRHREPVNEESDEDERRLQKKYKLS
jgi:hypothetical protein